MRPISLLPLKREPELAVRPGRDVPGFGVACREGELGDHACRRDPSDRVGAVVGEPEVAVGAGGDLERIGAGEKPGREERRSVSVVGSKRPISLLPSERDPEVAVRPARDPERVRVPAPRSVAVGDGARGGRRRSASPERSCRCPFAVTQRLLSGPFVIPIGLVAHGRGRTRPVAPAVVIRPTSSAAVLGVPERAVGPGRDVVRRDRRVAVGELRDPRGGRGGGGRDAPDRVRRSAR